MARWPCRADGAYQLATSAGAVEDNPVNPSLAQTSLGLFHARSDAEMTLHVNGADLLR